MSLMRDFKEFAFKGNVVDMAVGVVIGAAFGKVVSSFVGDLLMPCVSLVTGGVDFSSRSLVLRPAAGAAKAVTLNYGAFVSVAIDFLLIALAVFLMIKALASVKRKQPAAPPSEKLCRECLMKIPAGARRCAHCAQPQEAAAVR